MSQQTIFQFADVSAARDAVAAASDRDVVLHVEQVDGGARVSVPVESLETVEVLLQRHGGREVHAPEPTDDEGDDLHNPSIAPTI